MTAVRKFTDEEKRLIRQTCVPDDTTDSEFTLLISFAERTGLDPITRQIYLPKARKSKGVRQPTKPQATIDGFRVVAERTGKYAGQVGPVWCGEDGEWKDVWTSKEAPYAAKVGILREGFREPIYAVAEFEAYAQRGFENNLNPMWQKLGSHMIAKCAEALGLRKAFPQDLSGLYTDDEMAQAFNGAPDVEPPASEPNLQQAVPTAPKPEKPTAYLAAAWEHARSKSPSIEKAQLADAFKSRYGHGTDKATLDEAKAFASIAETAPAGPEFLSALYGAEGDAA